MSKHCLRSSQALLVAGAFVAFACQWPPPHDRFGLNTVLSLELSSEKLGAMETGTYSKSEASSSLWINEQRFRARVNYAGATQVDALKRSYALELDTPFRGRTAYRLSAMNGDPSAMRARLSLEAFEVLGFDTPRVEPVPVWVNDVYAGLYLMMETYDDDYFDSHDQEAVQVYQAENGMADFADTSSLALAFSEKLGSCGRSDLQTVVEQLAMSELDARCSELERSLDLDNVVRYMAASTLLDNRDGIDNNYYLARTREEPRFRLLPWDLDLTMVSPRDDTDVALFDANELFRSLIAESGCGRSYEAAHRETQRRLMAARLSDSVAAYADTIRLAFEADWFLSAAVLSLDEHLGEIRLYWDNVLDVHATSQ